MLLTEREPLRRLNRQERCAPCAGRGVPFRAEKGAYSELRTSLGTDSAPAEKKAIKMTPNEADFDAWIRMLDEDVIQGEFGYEPGEFNIFPSLWRHLYDEGITPKQAWRRALDEHANTRREEDAAKAANYARIVAADQAIRDKSTGRSHG